MALPENQAAVSEHGAVATDVQTATAVAGTVAAVATAIDPTEVQKPLSSAETTVLSFEELFRHITSAIPAASALAGFALPAEVATHAGFAIFHAFKAIFHLGKASAAPAKQ